MSHSPSPPPSEMPDLTREQVLIVMAITALVLFVIARLWMHLGHVSLFPHRWHPLAVLWGIGFAIAISTASAIVYAIWPQYRQSADHYVNMIVAPLAPWDIIWLGLLPGLSEELLFRGVMLPEFGLNREGVIISSLCFGALHMSSWRQWPYIFWATIVGGVLGFSAIWSGNLFVPIVAHSLTNIISGLVWQLRRPQTNR
jgi:uncharacterized protein